MAKILVIDDEQDVLDSMKLLLESIGHKVETALSGDNGIAKMREETYDLVLLDILMPKKSGIDVLQEIREDNALKNAKVAFLTVVPPSKEMEAIIRELKPAEDIVKPIDNKKFKKTIANLVGK